MNCLRSRIIVDYKGLGFLELLNNKKNVSVMYESVKNNYAIIYCNKEDSKYICESIKNDSEVVNAYISDERVYFYNF